MAEADTGALQPDSGSSIPRIKLGETGFLGLKQVDNKIYEEANKAFRYPQFIKTVNEMRNNPTVGSAMNVYKMFLTRVKWSIEPPVGATDVEKQRAKTFESMLEDMTEPWSDVISSMTTALEYGFSVNEIVLRRRLKKNGSKYNDGLVGIKKLPTRSQDTIAGWVFSEDGNELLEIEQSLAYVSNAYRYENRKDKNGNILLPIDKVLLYSVSKTKGNPEGNSIYKNIYLAYKQLTLLQEQQLISVAKDVQGILKITVPPRYLAIDASEEDKAVAVAFQQIIDNYNAGRQRGLLVPDVKDENGNSSFGYDLMESKGSKKNDVESIIKGLQRDILQALSVDILQLGTDGGSFALAESKSSILAIAIDSRLREISNVLTKLIRVVYEQNGWETDKLPTFKYEDTEEVSLEDFSKAIQRIFSTSAVEVDRAVLNKIRVALGVDPLPDDAPVDKEALPAALTGETSKSGAGMGVGTSGTGTAKKGGSGNDSSVSNSENT